MLPKKIFFSVDSSSEDCSSYLFTTLKVSKTRNVRCMQTNYITGDLALLLSFFLSFFPLLVSLEGESPSQVQCHLQTGSQVSLGSPAACLSTSISRAAGPRRFVPRLRRNNAVPECRGPSGNLTPGAFHPSWTPCLAYRRHTIRDSLKSR